MAIEEVDKSQRTSSVRSKKLSSGYAKLISLYGAFIAN